MATKKPSAAQVRARKLFAERAKAGTLKKSVKRPSQATGKKPTKRPVAHREKSVPGYFANPVHAPAKRAVLKTFDYYVETSLTGERYILVAGFIQRQDAEDYAHALAKVMPGMHIRVVEP